MSSPPPRPTSRPSQSNMRKTRKNKDSNIQEKHRKCVLDDQFEAMVLATSDNEPKSPDANLRFKNAVNAVVAANRFSTHAVQQIPARAFLPLSTAHNRANSINIVTDDQFSEDSLSGSDTDYEDYAALSRVNSQTSTDSNISHRKSTFSSLDQPNTSRTSIQKASIVSPPLPKRPEYSPYITSKYKPIAPIPSRPSVHRGSVSEISLGEGLTPRPQAPKRPTTRPHVHRNVVGTVKSLPAVKVSSSSGVSKSRAGNVAKTQAPFSPISLSPTHTSTSSTPELATATNTLTQHIPSDVVTCSLTRSTSHTNANDITHSPSSQRQSRPTGPQPHQHKYKHKITRSLSEGSLELLERTSHEIHARRRNKRGIRHIGKRADEHAPPHISTVIPTNRFLSPPGVPERSSSTPTSPVKRNRNRANTTTPSAIAEHHTWKVKRTGIGKTCVTCGTLTVRSALKCTVCFRYIHERCISVTGGCWGVGGRHPALTGRHHAFVMTTFVQPTFCLVCWKLCKGIVDQGERCLECPYTVHRHCRMQAPPTCTVVESLSMMKGKGSIGRSLRADGYMAHYPVVLIPGLCSSGLLVQKSEEKPGWEDTRLWLSINKLGGSTLFKTNDVTNISDTMSLSQAAAAQRNTWLRHLCLDQGIDDPPGIQVRPMEGIDAVDFLEPGALTGTASYVFSEIIEELRFVGYTNSNLVAAPYDWRLAPCVLESRDKYFTNLANTIEELYETNNQTPVIIFGHSMGVSCSTYFLHFVKQQRGSDWIDRHLHMFFAAGGPWLGAYKAIKSSVVGEDFGLPFINKSEALLMCRSMGSTGWLLPRGPLVRNQFIFVREEGTWIVGPFISTLLPEAGVQLDDTLTLHGLYGKHSFKTKADRKKGTYVWTKQFQVASASASNPVGDEIMKFVVKVGGNVIGSATILLENFVSEAHSVAKKVDLIVPNDNKDDPSCIVGDLLIQLQFSPATNIDTNVPDFKTKRRKGKTLTYKVRSDWKDFLTESAAHAVVSSWERDYANDPLLQDWAHPPPVPRLLNVHGINLPTEAGYAFRVKTESINSCLFTKFKLDNNFKSTTHKCVSGIAYENKYTFQSATKHQDPQIPISGDGTVTYQSLSFPENWTHGYEIQVESVEFDKMEHREMLADPRLIGLLITKACDNTSPTKM
eukprot:CFRG4166T1